ncbi:hypothetical protein EB796_019865 [Bugula neritina]|uniref:Uncharacterized protein n=1 Tax=Bugula neritina TaxID=10212 RepID=A0A7J7J7T7_BUGNE|nr:hypothetical protein EB796_019865 [Bugula neritina]
MGTSYHQEALRKQRMLERSHAALERIRGGNGNTFGQKDGSDYVSPLTISQPERAPKPSNTAGCLSGKDSVHVDRIYSVMYPDKNNPTYLDDPCRVNRRQNVEQSKYEALQKINGTLHIQLVNEKKFFDQ